MWFDFVDDSDSFLSFSTWLVTFYLVVSETRAALIRVVLLSYYDCIIGIRFFCLDSGCINISYSF